MAAMRLMINALELKNTNDVWLNTSRTGDLKKSIQVIYKMDDVLPLSKYTKCDINDGATFEHKKLLHSYGFMCTDPKNCDNKTTVNTCRPLLYLSEEKIIRYTEACDDEDI